MAAGEADDGTPLAGLRVLDLSALLPGPWTTLLLAELGADVVKVERPGDGDPARSAMPGLFAAANRGKRSVALDLTAPEDRAVLDRLAGAADVLVEGFRPGVTERLGIDAEQTCTRHPRLVYCSLTGYGSDGPYARLPGHDVDYLAVSGVLSLCGEPDGPPAHTSGVPVADLAAALFAVQAVLAALWRRERTGRGAHLDVPIAATALKLAEPRIAEHDAGGHPPKSVLMGRAAYGAYAGADGRWFTVGCVEPHFWERLCRLLGRADLLADERFATWAGRCRHAADVEAVLVPAFATRTAAEWVALLREHDVPAAPVNGLDDLGRDPQVRHWGLLSGGDVRTVGYPVLGLPKRPLAPAPSVGEHTAAFAGGWADG